MISPVAGVARRPLREENKRGPVHRSALVLSMRRVPLAHRGFARGARGGSARMVQKLAAIELLAAAFSDCKSCFEA